MTSIESNVVDRRVLIDWDGDSHFNEGVLQSTPANLFPTNLYASATNLRGFNAAFTAENFTDVPDISPRGFIKRSIRLGDEAITIRFLWDGYLSRQPQVGDTTNQITGAADFDTASWEYITSDTLGTSKTLSDIPLKESELVGYKVGNVQNAGGGGNVYVFGMSATNGGVAHKPLNPNGFWDAGFLYSKVIDAASTSITYGGFPAITAGQSYTFIFYYYLPPQAAYFGATTQTLRPRLYANGGSASTPNFGRQYIAGTDVAVANDTWTAFRYTFTAPAGATRLALDIQTSSGTYQVTQIGGFMLLSGTVALPTRFWDSRITFRDDQFSYVFPGDSNAYVLSYYVRSPNGITKLTPTRQVANLGSNTITSTAQTVINVTSSWQRVTMAIASSASIRGVWVTYTAEKSGVTVDASHAGDVEFSGFMITQGAIDTYPFHSGALYGYDDITDYVLNLNTQSGKSSFNDSLPAEGTATFTMNNADERFSPKNTASPLYGYMNQNLKVKVQVYNNTDLAWEDVWSGWTSEFDVVPGTTGSNQATIMAQQGLFRLAEGKLNVPVQEQVTMDTLARDIIEASGWRSTANPLQSFVGLHTLVGQNAYTLNTTLLYDVVEEGVNTIEISGKDWSQSTDPRKALEDVLQAENAQMWINRDGSISIVNRNHWVTDEFDDTIVLDTAVNQAEYVYGQDLINAVEISVNKNKALLDQPVWATRRPVYLRANQRWVVDLNPAYTEGKTRTVITYTLDGMTKSVYTKDIGILNDTSNAASQAQVDAVFVTLVGKPGERPQLRITNTNNVPLWVMLSIKGDYLETGDTLIVKIKDDVSIETVQGKHTVSYSNPLLSDERQAESYGEFLMQRQGFPVGEFRDFTITVRNQDDLDRVLNLGIGSIVVLSEVKTAEDEVHHTIIGEDFSIDNSKTLTVTYHVARTLQEDYYKADVSLAEDPTLNHIPQDLLDAAQSVNGGIVAFEEGSLYGLERIMTWQSGNGGVNRLILAPSRDQLHVWQVFPQLYRAPDTDAVGGVVTNPFMIYPRWTYGKLLANGSGQLLMPLGQDKLTWFIPGNSNVVMAGGGTPQGFMNAWRSKTTDESVGAASTFAVTYPVLAGGRYYCRANYFIQDFNVAVTSPTTSGMGLGILANHGSPSQWASTSVYTGNNRVVGANNYNRHSDATFRARYSGAGGVDFGAIGFQLYTNTGLAVWQDEALVNMHLLRFSDYGKISNVELDTAVSHKYTLFARTDYASVAASWTLTVIAEDGTTIGTHAQSIPVSGVTKFEVNIPSGNASAWGYLTKTTDDYVDTKLFIYGYGITIASPSTYLDLLTENSQDTVFA